MVWICPKDCPNMFQEPEAKAASKKRKLVPDPQDHSDLLAQVALLLGSSVEEVKRELISRHTASVIRPAQVRCFAPIVKRPLPASTLEAPKPAPKPEPTALQFLLDNEPEKAMSGGLLHPERILRAGNAKCQLKGAYQKPRFADFSTLHFPEPVTAPREEKREEDDEDEFYNRKRPESPGREMDKLFIPPEIGREAPRDRTERYRRLYATSDKAEVEAILRQVAAVSSEEQKEYRKIENSTAVEKEMIDKHYNDLFDGKRIKRKRYYN